MPTYQSPPIYQNDKPRPAIELGDNKYPGPQGRPVQAESNWKWGGGKKKKKPPVGGPVNEIDSGQVEGKPPEMRAMPQPGWNGPVGGNGERRLPPGYDRNAIGGSFPGGGMKPPQQNDFMDRSGRLSQEAIKSGLTNDRGGLSGYGGQDPRAGGLNKVTGQWTPPDPAYLEGLKNGTIEPEWKRREKLNQPVLQGPGQGWEKGSPQDMYQQFQQWQTQGPGSTGQPPMSSPTTGTPAPGGRPGRQPLRPGMEYRPGGGQRPVGGGMRGNPQDGGAAQFDPNDPAQSGLVAGGQDPNQMNAWRQKLMQMQQQGPMNNKFYGAF